MIKEAEIMKNLLKGLWSNRFQWNSGITVSLVGKDTTQVLNEEVHLLHSTRSELHTSFTFHTFENPWKTRKISSIPSITLIQSRKHFPLKTISQKLTPWILLPKTTIRQNRNLRQIQSTPFLLAPKFPLPLHTGCFKYLLVPSPYSY